MSTSKKILFSSIFALSIPLKLILDLITYLFELNIPSTTSLALPLAIFGSVILKSNIRKSHSSLRIATYSFFYILITTIVSMISFSQYSIGVGDITLNSIGTSLLLYFIYLIAGIGNNYNERTNSILLLLAVILTTIITIWTQFAIKDVWMQLNESGAYLRIADLYALSFLLIYPKFQNIFLKSAFVTLGTTTLLFLGSRSSLIFFICALLFTSITNIFINGGRNLPSLSKFMLVFCIILFPAYLKYDDVIATSLSESRIFQTIDSEGNSGIDDRSKLLAKGLSRITESPLFGNWMYRLSMSDNGGDYIHNILFMWDDFGLFVFMIMLFLIFSVYRKILGTPEYSVYLSGLNYCIFSLIFSRAYAFPYIFLFIGLTFFAKEFKPKSNQILF